MVKILAEFLAENWMVLCGSVFFVFISLVTVLMCRKKNIAIYVDAEIVKIDDGICECVFWQAGKKVEGFICPCPDEFCVGDILECEVGTQDQESGLWGLFPLAFVGRRNPEKKL